MKYIEFPKIPERMYYFIYLGVFIPLNMAECACACSTAELSGRASREFPNFEAYRIKQKGPKNVHKNNKNVLVQRMRGLDHSSIWQTTFPARLITQKLASPCCVYIFFIFSHDIKTYYMYKYSIRHIINIQSRDIVISKHSLNVVFGRGWNERFAMNETKKRK